MPADRTLPPALPAKVSKLRVDGFGEVCLYSRAGADGGRPVLLVHTVNAAASAYDVRPVFEGLSDARGVHALDLPGFGRSDRPERRYTPRLMTDAVHAAVDAVRATRDAPLHLLGASLGTEFVARAVYERPDAFASVALVSPTGLEGGRRRDGPEGSTLGKDWAHRMLTCGGLGRLMFRGLRRPGVIRYFLEKTWGRREIDEGLHAYCVQTTRVPGAEHAPLSFLSGFLFSGDINRVYEAIGRPGWITHGVRGDFVKFGGAASLAAQPHWSIREYDTGALPYFEQPDTFVEEYEAFLEGVDQ